MRDTSSAVTSSGKRSRRSSSRGVYNTNLWPLRIGSRAARRTASSALALPHALQSGTSSPGGCSMLAPWQATNTAHRNSTTQLPLAMQPFRIASWILKIMLRLRSSRLSLTDVPRYDYFRRPPSPQIATPFCGITQV